MEKPAIQLSGISDLIQAIQDTNQFFLGKVQRQVNTSLTLRNWVIGYYIAEYEQQGKDRAEYGETLYAKIAEKLKAANLDSIRERHLYICKNFYLSYPQILRTLSAKSPDHVELHPTDPNLLLNRLSFSSQNTSLIFPGKQNFKRLLKNNEKN